MMKVSTQWLVAAIFLSTSACRDGLSLVDGPVDMPGGTLLGYLECKADIVEGRVICRESSLPAAEARPAVLGENQIKLVSTNIVSDTVAETFGFDVTLQNLLLEPIGTPDGVVSVGSKVFYESGPVATAYKVEGDTGTVTVANADGYGNFTAVGQPYHSYDELLGPSQVSDVKRWMLRVPRTVASFSFTVRVFTQIPSQPVEIGPPDGVPDWVYAPDKVSTDLPGLSGTYVRDVVAVLFHPGTSLAARKAAVDSVNGVVVGGIRMPGGDGEYYLQIPDDGTIQPLLGAIERLEGLPQVLGVGPEFILDEHDLAHLRPTDGPGFTSWSLDAEHAAGANWALEAIEAPAAWGCEVGSPNARVAVVDLGFHTDTVPDLRANTRSIHHDYTWDRRYDHGTRVLSVLAARGNNGVGMTGVMWEAGLDLHGLATNNRGEPTLNAQGKPAIRNTIPRLMGAIASGAPIVNLSIGLGWDGEPGGADDHQRVRLHYSRLRGWMTWHAVLGRKPLLVVAAGNIGRDAYWSGYPNLVTDFGDRVIAVGAVAGDGASSMTAWEKSSSGTLVEIAAPGVGVRVLSGTDALESNNGTSLAAPMVAGVAGLLLSFDPRMSSKEIKDLLIMGANAGGRRVQNVLSGGTIPVLNAHESLRIAAEQPGAPLCGNRVWLENGTVTVNRNLHGTSTEALFNAPAGATDLRAMHGGKSIALWAGGGIGSQLYRWNNGVWSLDVQAAPDSVFDLEDPVGRSRRSRSHDRDSVVIGWSNPGSIDVYLRSVEPGPQRFIGQLVVPQHTASGSNECRRLRTADTIQVETCMDSVYIGWSNSREEAWPRLSPRGDGVTVGYAINRTATAFDGDWYTCPGEPEPLEPGYQRCRNVRYDRSYPQARLYWISTGGGSNGAAPELKVADSGVAFWNMAIADGPREFMVQRYGSTSSQVYGWVMESGFLRYKLIQSTQTLVPCHVQFRDLRSGAVLQTIPHCPWADPTIAPDRAVAGGGHVESAPAPPSAPQGRVARMRGALMTFLPARLHSGRPELHR